ncbi:uncharacterized protein LOC110349357 isoform X15 [Heterocephalus glaber]|uniref:Uncharacterized protein LOC110349357 isoform X15 n=1 Tax=Heterocephalus glaber TaxID=10181 RepID=A0AAX6SYL1_HETGA|nr:uncharacterized protein LOC110349357 isoform X15 [Heterocephalus glaber]XP_021114558.1 uncharacterized protein LOC110349357 isoform X15 [Heterocephalus glaber]
MVTCTWMFIATIEKCHNLKAAKMSFNRLFKFLYVAHIILAGVVYHYFQMSVGKIAPEIVAESSQPIGKTLRPVWGMMMDKCYPETTQRCKIKSGKAATLWGHKPQTNRKTE